MIVRRKRLVKIGDTVYDCGGEQLLLEFIEPDTAGAFAVYSEAIRQAVEYIKKGYSFNLEDLLINRIWSVVNLSIKYQFDNKFIDYWNSPSETWSDKLGDCEDSTFLGQAAVEVSGGNLAKRSYVAIGYYIQQNSWFGHAFGVYTPTVLNQMCILEYTWDTDVPPYIWYPLKGNPAYHPSILFNKREEILYPVDQCDRCREMIQYLETGSPNTFKNRISKSKPVKPTFELVIGSGVERGVRRI